MDLRAPLPPDHFVPTPTTDVDKVPTILEPSSIQNLLCRIYLASQMMELSSESRFTSIILFRRYVCHFQILIHKNWQQQHRRHKKDSNPPCNQEMKQIKRHLGRIAAACLFLGCKAEEEPRRIRDVINLSSILDFEGIGCVCSTLVSTLANDCGDSPSKQTEASIEQSPTKAQPVIIIESTHPPPLDDKYWSDKEQMVSTEQHLLRQLQFDTLVCHPYRCVLIVMETLRFGNGTNSGLLSPKGSEALICKAFTVLNEISIDAVHGTTILQSDVVTLACAVISVADAANRTNDDVESMLPDEWWRALDVQTDELSSVVQNINNLIHR